MASLFREDHHVGTIPLILKDVEPIPAVFQLSYNPYPCIMDVHFI